MIVSIYQIILLYSNINNIVKYIIYILIKKVEKIKYNNLLL
jgi:hypothetical protein